MDLLSFDRRFSVPLIGIDEVGLGSVAGPIFVVAVGLPENPDIARALMATGVKDSKRMIESSRARVFQFVEEHAIPYSVAVGGSQQIDKEGVSTVLDSLFERVIQDSWNRQPQKTVLIDGQTRSGVRLRHTGVVQGDNCSLCIATASVVAKHLRDSLMQDLHDEYPEYGWANNKGYPTPEHLRALSVQGPSEHHRMSTKTLKRLNESLQ